MENTQIRVILKFTPTKIIWHNKSRYCRLPVDWVRNMSIGDNDRLVVSMLDNNDLLISIQRGGVDDRIDGTTRAGASLGDKNSTEFLEATEPRSGEDQK